MSTNRQRRMQGIVNNVVLSSQIDEQPEAAKPKVVRKYMPVGRFYGSAVVLTLVMGVTYLFGWSNHGWESVTNPMLYAVVLHFLSRTETWES